MRLVPLGLLLAALLPAPVFAGTVAVDLFARTVETSRFKIQFDYSHQDEVRSLVFKDWSSTQSIGAYEGVSNEFWGQTLRNVDSTGFIQPPQTEASDMAITFQSNTQAEVTIEQLSSFQPLTLTSYRFFADQPYFLVTRTIEFSGRPDSTAYQAYLPRVPFVNSYRAIRYRDGAHQLQQRIYAFQGVVSSDWDGRWLQQVELNGSVGFSVAAIYDSSTVQTHQFVRGYGPNSFTGWAAAYLPAGPHTLDETQRLMVAFSTDAANVTAIDSLWAQVNRQAYLLDVPAARTPGSGVELAAAPNPARGATRLAWTLAQAGRAQLTIHDLGGRRIATLHDGLAAAGAHTSAWDGRDASGTLAPPGVYLARIVTASDSRTVRVVRLR